MKLVAEPHIPFALWLTLAIVALAAMVWYGLSNKMSATRRQKALILGLMSLALTLPLLVLLNLTWIQNVPPPGGKPVIRILIDSSASMATPDIEGQPRIARAQELATQAAGALEDRFDIRVSTFDQALKPSDIETPKTAQANQSNLAAAISQSIKEDIPQGQAILLLSDGIHNVGATQDVVDAATKAQAMNVPIFTSTLGSDVGVKNLALSLRSPQELAFVGQVVASVVNVKAQGVGNRPVTVGIYRDGEEIESREVSLDEANQLQTSFNISQSQPGLYRYEVLVKPIDDEATEADNRSTLLLRVVDRPIKMLLVEGKPYWDTKFLVRRLAADPSVELTSVIRMAKDRFMKRTVARSNAPGNPEAENQNRAENRAENRVEYRAVEDTTIIKDANLILSPESLAQVQIVVLGRSAEFFLEDDSLDALRNWISRDGGSLVCARGAPSAQINQRLSQILPVSWSNGRESRFRVSMTTQGRDLRWLAGFGEGDVLGSMPSLATVATATRRQGLTNVLATTINSGNEQQAVPVLSYQPYGSGRTVVVEGAGMWRWALMSPEHQEREEVYATLWRSLLRWLVSRAGLLPGQDVSLQPDRVSFDAGDVSTATMLVRRDKINKIPSVRVQSTDGSGFDQEFEPRPIGQDPGVYRLDFGILEPGQYTAQPTSTLSGASTDTVKTAFDVRQRWVEKLELDARPDLMSRIAEASDGEVLEQANPLEFAERFDAHLERSRPPQFRRIAMWDRWWVLLGVLGLWAATWIVRRRSGLI